MSFSGKNDAESFRNFIKNSVLDPKCAKLILIVLRKVYGKLTESLRNLQDLSRRTHKGPYGPIRAHMGPYAPIWAHMGPYMGPYGPIYGPIRAYMGLYGPQPGPGPNPDWAPTRLGPESLQ